MPKLPPRHCQRNGCSNSYVPTGPAQKYCPDCIPAVRKENARKRSYEHAVRTGRIKKPGVGSGNAGHRPDGFHSRYRTGKGIYQRIAFEAHGYSCNRCGVDVRTLKPYQYAVHHCDRDRLNNTPENLEVLCKRCHQLEHECANNLSGEK